MKTLAANFKQLPKLLKWIIVISLTIFIFSLSQPAFFIDRQDDPNAYSNSLILLLTGWMSFLGGAFLPFVIWLANPLYFVSLILIIKRKIAGMYLSFGATILALIFSQLNSIMTSESGSTSNITSLGLGFKLWLACFVVLSFGIFTDYTLTKKKNQLIN